jgi:hypothetical protein
MKDVLFSFLQQSTIHRRVLVSIFVRLRTMIKEDTMDKFHNVSQKVLYGVMVHYIQHVKVCLHVRSSKKVPQLANL